MEDNQPLTWPDGSPRMQLVITLAPTSAKGDDDDGIRKLYAKGGKYEVADGTGTSMKDAIADAVKKAGARSIDAGRHAEGRLTPAMGKKTNRGFSAPKLYRAVVHRPGGLGVGRRPVRRREPAAERLGPGASLRSSPARAVASDPGQRHPGPHPLRVHRWDLRRREDPPLPAVRSRLVLGDESTSGVRPRTGAPSA